MCPIFPIARTLVMLVTTHHKSRTHEFFIKYNLRIPEHLTPHRHYRLVLDTIGRKLENFRCSWEMVNAVYAALVGTLTNC
jgi:hypothetical protein